MLALAQWEIMENRSFMVIGLRGILIVLVAMEKL